MPDPSATAILRETSEDLSLENDFADLAARFSAVSGGGLSPELSADLALEIVLNEVVEQACRITGATGAAILLDREGEMVCRASSGTTSPELGSRIDAESGIAGECLKSRRTQCCDDALSDPRANIEASEQLGVRSVIAMPLLHAAELLGVLEVFSTEPFAFGVRDERALEVLADRTVENLQRASQKAEVEAREHVVHVDLPEIPSFAEEVIPQKTEPIAPDMNATTLAESAEAAFGAATEANLEMPVQPLARAKARPGDLVTRSLVVAVVAAAILLGVGLGRHVASTRRAKSQAAATAPFSLPIQNAQSAKESVTPSTKVPLESAKPASPATEAVSAMSRRRNDVPPGGLMIFENGKEVFRSVPVDPAAAGKGGKRTVQMAAEVAPESGSISLPDAEREVIHRVSPEYPQAAREQKIEGRVVLDVHIGADGAVQGIEVVSGAPLLAQASTRAVQQWKFKPSVVNGRPAEMQTTITLNFKLE